MPLIGWRVGGEDQMETDTARVLCSGEIEGTLRGGREAALHGCPRPGRIRPSAVPQSWFSPAAEGTARPRAAHAADTA